MTENLTNTAWKCKKCGEVTYHPGADRNAVFEMPKAKQISLTNAIQEAYVDASPRDESRIRELEAKIVAVCVNCPHAKWTVGRFECDRKRSQCHSKRVRRWLDEIKRLEGESDND